MSDKKKAIPTEKVVLHPKNKHRNRYDFPKLTETCPELGKYVKPTGHGDVSIDFANPKAVKWLNKALLKQYYSLEYWDIPTGYLCPPVSGRADYIHHIAELLGASNEGNIPIGYKIKCMDIGVGASCVYPVIGNKEYGWSFVGTDIDTEALKSADKIISNNHFLKRNVDLRLQANPKDIFHTVMLRTEPIDITICNPPFHASADEALQGTIKKISSLNHKKTTEPVLNFGGQSHELWCDGGEVRFVLDMIRQSKQFQANCFWFSTLISKQSHLKLITDALTHAGVAQQKLIPMAQGTKISRILAWTFLNAAQQKKWIETRWNIL
jgi:23S rRNA (adenine1618-N6)-methyltransferase